MKKSSKFIVGFMLVMLVCCVSVVSATDIDSTDDTVSTDEIAVDDVSEIVVEDVEINEVSDDVEDVKVDDVEEIFVKENELDLCDYCGINDTSDDTLESSRATSTYHVVNSSNYLSYFNRFTGRLIYSYDLEFQGTFSYLTPGNYPFKYFVIDKNIGLKFTNAVFNNVGFKLSYPGLTMNGANFSSDINSLNTESIYVDANNVTIINVTINNTVPLNKTYYSINIFNSHNTQILNSIINYECGYKNPDFYNYVIKVKNSVNVKVAYNNITANLPLKTVKHYTQGIEGLDKDFVAGVGITDSNYFNFTRNNMEITTNNRVGNNPTLDAFIMWYSNNSYIGDNKISEIDPITNVSQYSYIYGVDVYKSDNVTVHNNTINMNADLSGGYVGGNGTGAAYCVQFTGPYTGVIVSNNRLTTKNNGPNAAIYSQNWDGPTNITVKNNVIDVIGKGTSATWDVLTGIELQDDYATVTGNIINVKNRGNSYGMDYNVYGISYCQYSPRTHTYIIKNNDIYVGKGYYSIYIMNGDNCVISGNSLRCYYPWSFYYGNQTVYIAGTGNYVGPNN